MQSVIPDKTYFKIGEVARLADIKTSVLRFWETEFSFLNPEKSSAGQRLYTKQDIEMVQQIKQLLYQEKYTIEGVRKKFSPRKTASARQQQSPPADLSTDLQTLLRLVRQELQAIRAIL
ncbi:transcriptional regulator, MerR family [Trichlorobacter thiogenes]|uniref:Transcriptional regulator, MerR family n=1 Tax=Trichlorobacter thiogenes TaxID=115783 RepID=A0A1T4R0R5_9BACT|nr:MerR family transcriptional regulator [Trichlorobacter thiogenes]SKA09446.1 transcriptional regulator, MerR family [Trichlorobacter thiogenes]